MDNREILMQLEIASIIEMHFFINVYRFKSRDQDNPSSKRERQRERERERKRERETEKARMHFVRFKADDRFLENCF